MTRVVLALDQGSHASRACVFDESGTLCAACSVPVATRHTAGTRVEHDADELVDSVQRAALAALRAARNRHARLECIGAGLAVQRSSVVCCTPAGAPLSAVLSWQDRRHAQWLTGLATHEARITELTGLPLSPHYGASKLRWCLDELPAVQRAAERAELLMAPLASFLALRLSGAPATVDPANASRTLLWDSGRGDWSDELLALFALRREWLPRARHTCGDFGMLQLDAGPVPLRALTGDQSAVPFAAGSPDHAAVYINLGTGAFIQRPLAMRAAHPAPLLGSVLSRDDSGTRYSLEGTVNGAGSATTWLCQIEQLEESALWAALETLAPHTPLPCFINGVGGLGSPWWRAHLAPRFLGSGGPLQRFAAVVESIAFMIAVNVQELTRQAGAPRRLVLSGGMSRSAWLCRRLAALLGLPVTTQHAEASARGAAALAAPALASHWPAPQGASWQAAPDAALAARYQLFQETLAAALAGLAP